MSEYLTTVEVAELLRIKERKVYDLASSGVLPCNKAIGKLLFPRDQIDAWLANHAEHVVQPLAVRPPVFLGSHDPLLEWALRESCSGLAMLFDGSQDGIQRFLAREGVAVGLHIHHDKTQTWNEHAVKRHCAQNPVVLLEWAVRKRGLIVTQQYADQVASLDDVANLRFVARQAEAGAQVLLEQLLSKRQIKNESMHYTHVARTETDVANALSSGVADVGFGLACVAATYKLHFVPVVEERFDLLIDRAHYFEDPMQRLMQFCTTDKFKQYAASLSGYDSGNMGRVIFNSSTEGI